MGFSNISAPYKRNKFFLHFDNPDIEERYLHNTNYIRKTQIRSSLFLASTLYFFVCILDLFIIPEDLSELILTIHLSQAIWLFSIAALLLRTESMLLHTLSVSGVVLVAWCIHVTLSSMLASNLLFGEAYLMIIWLWVVTGLSLKNSSYITLAFIIIFESALLNNNPYQFEQLLSHQYFVFVSVLIGALGAYLAEYYRRENFANNESILNLSQAVAQSGEAIIISDSQGIIEYVNPTFCSNTGFSRDNVTGTKCHVLSDSSMPSDDFKEMWGSIREGKTWQGSGTGIKNDGSTFPALISVAPIMDKDGNITHYVSTQKDMSDYHQMENILRHTQKMEAVGTLVGGIAHDFNNTLAGISGHLHLARMDVEHLPETAAMLDKIDDLAFRSAEVIKQLLAFSRKGIVHRKAMDISQFFDDVTRLHIATMPANIKFESLNNIDGALYVKGDANQLEQVIINLLNNARFAVAHTDHPTITITLSSWKASPSFIEKYSPITETLAHISVTDNGTGIEASKLDQIFDPFFTTKEAHEGTGLGLSMAYGTLTSHKGIITVSSELGVGSQFNLYLPIISEPQIQELAHTESVPLHVAGTTILVTDDNEAVLDSLCKSLEKQGYNVLQASNGKQAVDIFKIHRDNIKLAILDIVMPELGGIEVAHKVREINAKLPIIFTTGYEPSQYFNNDEMSEETVVLKPFKMNEFSLIISNKLKA